MNRFTVRQTHTHRDIMNDKEKLEAIKKVLSDTPARSESDQVTAQDFEKALDKIDKIIES